MFIFSLCLCEFFQTEFMSLERITYMHTYSKVNWSGPISNAWLVTLLASFNYTPGDRASDSLMVPAESYSL